MKGRNSERRASVRYPVDLEVRYSVEGRGEPVETGSGRTIDLSSSGLSFSTGGPLSIGQKLDVSIDWPVALDRGLQLQVLVSGVVVRISGALIALRIERHEFRTRRAGTGGVTGQESDGEAIA
jgi:hypothetical protein